MRVRFWGTRGSIPVALTSADIRHKIEQALALAIASGVDSPEKLHAFIEHDLGFSISHTYGGHSSCVEFETGRAEYLVCDMGRAHAHSATASFRDATAGRLRSST
jgi:hypothetical protein